MLTVFNANYRFGDTLAPLTQDEIYHTPEFYAMSVDEILRSGRCPAHLSRVLQAMPFSGRPNYVQVRPQDFRKGAPYILGDGWHVDVNTALVNGRMHVARDLSEFTSMVVSFGDVVETEFVEHPFTIDAAQWSPFDHSRFHEKVTSMNPSARRSAPNQVAIYTSTDVHRVAPGPRIGNMRLIIVTVEQDNALEAGAGDIRPSIRQKEGK
jgi:hypothetical protein